MRNRLLPLLFVASFIVMITCAHATPARAAAGDIDATFPGYPLRDARAHAMVVQPDGRFLVAGMAGDGASGVDFLLLRFEAAGAIDTTFGNGQKVTTDFLNSSDIGQAIALQPDGKIVVAGYSFLDQSFFALARYERDGSLDVTFGRGGKVMTMLPDSGVNALGIQSDGKIVVAGWSRLQIALARYDTTGQLDPGFGRNGVLITDLATEAESVSDLVLQPDGKIVVAGYGRGGSICQCHGGLALVRYLNDGSLDPVFGSAGVVITAEEGANFASGIALQPDGRIVVTGSSLMSDLEFLVARYRSTGDLDSSFGGDGIVTTSLPPSKGHAAADVAVEADGRIIAVGSNGIDDLDGVLVRYGSDGTPDPTFGLGGIVRTDFGGQDDVVALALVGSTHYLVAGFTHSTSVPGLTMILARYAAAPTADLGLTQIDMPDPVRVAEDLTYQLTASNAGPEGASDVLITDRLSAVASFVSASPGCTYDSATHTVSCTVGAIGVGTNVTVTLVVRPTAGGVMTNTASVGGRVIDGFSANNIATVSTDVNGPPPSAGPSQPPGGCGHRPPGAPPSPACP